MSQFDASPCVCDNRAMCPLTSVPETPLHGDIILQYNVTGCFRDANREHSSPTSVFAPTTRPCSSHCIRTAKRLSLI
jgi:hypothetical protein